MIRSTIVVQILQTPGLWEVGNGAGPRSSGFTVSGEGAEGGAPGSGCQGYCSLT